MKFKDHLREQIKNPDFAKEYTALGPEYELVRQIIQAREEKSLTQEDLAQLTGIPQAHISRIENGNYNPSLAYLKRIASGLGKELHIQLK